MKKSHTDSDSVEYIRITPNGDQTKIRITWGKTTFLILFLILMAMQLIESEKIEEIILFIERFLS